MERKELTVVVCHPSVIIEEDLLMYPKIADSSIVSYAYHGLVPNYIINCFSSYIGKVYVIERFPDHTDQQRVVEMLRALYEWIHDKYVNRLLLFVDPLLATVLKRELKAWKGQPIVNAFIAGNTHFSEIPCSERKIIFWWENEGRKVEIYITTEEYREHAV